MSNELVESYKFLSLKGLCEGILRAGEELLLLPLLLEESTTTGPTQLDTTGR